MPMACSAWLPTASTRMARSSSPIACAAHFVRLLHDGRDVRKPDRGTVLLGHDQTLVVLGRLELIVVVDR
jgi:hypothetical protein